MTDEKIIVGSKTKYPLDGILSIPDMTNGPFPAVVLVQGSGPSNMDEKIGAITPFKDLAEGLSKKGIAVLRYDKRTFVYRKEMKSDSGLTVKEETIEDAILAANLLREDSRINPIKVFIIGHSLGGMLAPRIDAEGGDFAGIVILGGSPRKFEEILLDQNNAVLESVNRFLKMIARKQIAKLSSKFDNVYTLSDEEAKATPILGKHVKAYYIKEMGQHPSVDYLKVLHKPILVLQGEKDFHVSMEHDYQGYKSVLKNHPSASFKSYPNLNHVFMPSVYGEILKAKKEYKVPQHVDRQVIEEISDWILSL